MKKLFLLMFIASTVFSQRVQITFDGNNISSEIWNSGILDQNLIISNNPGFEWPKGSHQYAMFSTGLCISGLVNDSVRMASASYKGEYTPGYSTSGQFHTDSRFKFYSVKSGDNYLNNPDWLNWGLMVPFGAPFIDVNNNGTYEYYADTPGVKNAAQTIFICLTDGDPSRHMIGEGLGGGTAPLFAELHFTLWAYNNPGYQDMQFLKWEIINRGTMPWTAARFSIYCDADLGFSDDDHIGCDTTRNLAYCYNGDNDDDGGSFSYGIDPPAVGISGLLCNNSLQRLTSMVYITGTSIPGPACEKDANGEAIAAYNFFKGVKKDGTPWVIPNTNPPQTTKFCYSGDPETGVGWTEFTGSIWNCGGMLTGQYIPVNPVGDRRFLMSYGSDNFTVNVSDTEKITAVQLIARGTNNLNSVTRLKQQTDVAQQLCSNGFVIGINPVSTEIPTKFSLYQNYPNPFNPVTKIKFEIPLSKGGERVLSTKLIIYNALGQEIATLVNEQLKPGTYFANWNAPEYPSGIYFYKLETDKFSETKKMVLIK